MALTFTQWLEEFRPFPTDRVNRQIERLKKKGGAENEGKAKTLENQKKYQTDMKTDSMSKNAERARRPMVGKKAAKKDTRYNKYNSEFYKLKDKEQKAGDKEDKLGTKEVSKNKKKAERGMKKYEKAHDKMHKAEGERKAKTTAMVSFNSRPRDDDTKQVKHNMEVERQRKAAESMHKAKPAKETKEVKKQKKAADRMYKAKPQPQRIKVKSEKRPGIIKKPKNESMNFTDYINSTISPLYEKEGEAPKCPPGYRFDKEMMMCVPKTPKDKVGNGEKEGNKDLKPGNGAGYNTWGNSGYDGAGYAWEEPATGTNDNSGGY